jgi:hypothetical protein
MTPNLEATLLRLCELEPERFEARRWAGMPGKLGIAAFFVQFEGEAWARTHFEHPDPAEQAAGQGIILAAIMAAIEARGWEGHIVFREDQCIGSVATPEGRFGQAIATTLEIRRFFGRDTPKLHALALAYVQALEAEQAGGEG